MQLAELDFSEVYDPVESHNKKWEEHIRILRRYRASMEQFYKLSLAFNDLNKVFEPEDQKNNLEKNELLPSIYLALNITDVKFFNEQDKEVPEKADTETIKKIVCTYNHHFTVEYTPANQTDKKAPTFTAKTPFLDYMATDKDEAEDAVSAQIKSAVILVQTAKAAGWTKVTFGDTSDPLQRHVLKEVCTIFGLDCSAETVLPPSQLPQNAAFIKVDNKPESMEEAVKRLIGYSFEDVMRNPLQRFAIPEPQKTSVEAPAANNNDNIEPVKAATKPLKFKV